MRRRIVVTPAACCARRHPGGDPARLTPLLGAPTHGGQQAGAGSADIGNRWLWPPSVALRQRLLTPSDQRWARWTGCVCHTGTADPRRMPATSATPARSAARGPPADALARLGGTADARPRWLPRHDTRASLCRPAWSAGHPDSTAHVIAGWNPMRPRSPSLATVGPNRTNSAVFEVICRLADHLDSTAPDRLPTAPDGSTPTCSPGRQWRQICFDARAHPAKNAGTSTPADTFFRYSPVPTSTARRPDVAAARADRNSYLVFATSSPPRCGAASTNMPRHTARASASRTPHLDTSRQLADGLHLPGRDPDDIDLAAVRAPRPDRQTTYPGRRRPPRHLDRARPLRLHTAVDRPPRTWGSRAAPCPGTPSGAPAPHSPARSSTASTSNAANA